MPGRLVQPPAAFPLPAWSRVLRLAWRAPPSPHPPLALPFPVPWRLGHALGSLIWGDVTSSAPLPTPTRAAADAAAVAGPRPAQRAAFSPLDAGEAAGGAKLRSGTSPTSTPRRRIPGSPPISTRRRRDGKAFSTRFAGRLAGLGGDGLAEAIRDYERIEEVLGRAMSYGQLVFAGDAQDPANGRFYQTLQERVTVISSHLLFFTLELNRLEDAELERKIATSPALLRWQPWLRDLRVFRPHQLSDDLEKLLHEKEVTGRSAWNRLFDETIAGMTATVSGEEVTVSAALNRLSDSDRAVRAAAAKGVSEAFGSRIRLFSLITNTSAKDKEILDNWRNYPRPGSRATAPTWSRTRWWTRW